MGAYLEQRRNAIAQRYDSQAAVLRRQAAGVQGQIDAVDAQVAALGSSTSTLDTQQNLDVQRQGLADKYSGLISTADQTELAKVARQQTLDVVQQQPRRRVRRCDPRRFAMPPSAAHSDCSSGSPWSRCVSGAATG